MAYSLSQVGSLDLKPYAPLSLRVVPEHPQHNADRGAVEQDQEDPAVEPE